MVATTLNEWNPNIPPNSKRSEILLLLTIGGVAVKGVWCGQLGEYFVAWADLPVLTAEAKARIEMMTTHPLVKR